MKKFKLITTAAACLIAAACITPAPFAANAEQNEGQVVADSRYPADFNRELKFDNLSDYAVCGEQMAFAQETYLYILAPDVEGDIKLTETDFGSGITNLEYGDGTLYVGDSDGKTYAYPDLHTQIDYEFTASSRITVGDYLYFLSGDVLNALDGDNNAVVIGDGFGNLKLCNGTAYAVLTVSSENGEENKLYKLAGTAAEPVDLTYIDFSAAETIAIGDVAEKLKADYSVIKCTLNATYSYGGESVDAYCTETDINDLSGSYFKAGKTFKVTGVKTALKLADCGDAALIAMKDGNVTKTYLTNAAALTEEAYSAPEKDVESAYIISETGIYSVPYMCASTKLATLPQGARITVTEKCAVDAVEDTVYYKVIYEYSDGEQTASVSGYVAANYLTPYSFSSEQNTPTSTGTAGFTYETEIVSVILVIGIVGLVCIAIIYLTIVGTRGSAPSKQTKKKIVKDDEYEEE